MILRTVVVAFVCFLRKLLVFEYGQFKHGQREKNPKLVWQRVVILAVTLGGVV